MKKWMKFVLWLCFVSGIIVILVFEKKKDRESILDLPNINIHVEGQDSFLNEIEVLNRLKTHQLYGDRNQVSTLDILRVEAIFDTMQEVRSVEVFKGLSGSWTIDLELIRPIARVFPDKGDSYYLDSDGNKMARSSIHTARTLIFSGHIPDLVNSENLSSIINNDSLKSIRFLDDIYRISNYVCNDPFLQSLIGQVYLEKDQDFILIPVVGKHKIVFGKASTVKEVEDKFHRLKVFYKEALPFEGWNKYTEIILKYEGQVVCRKVS